MAGVSDEVVLQVPCSEGLAAQRVPENVMLRMVMQYSGGVQNGLPLVYVAVAILL